MISLSLETIAKVVGGQLIGPAESVVSSSVETDSRLLVAGSLFVAKPGEVTDGHNFLQDAKSAGATAAIVEHLVEHVELPQIIVANSVMALGELARYVVAEVKSKGSLRIVGITGSNGKTTTKNMLRTIFEKFGETVAPIESFNNEVGAPYSMLRVTEETKFLVVELGAGGKGSIRYLAEMVEIDLAIELKVGLAHAGEFGSIENTQQIKAELVESLRPNAKALLNADDALVAEMQNETAAEVFWFGSSAQGGYQISAPSTSLDGTSFDFKYPDGESLNVQLQIIGEHHAMNAGAALASADLLALDRNKSVAALAEMPLAEQWRMQVLKRTDGLVLINDAYNASPESTRAALRTLAELAKQTGRRSVAVLGEMAELGEFSAHEHDQIGRLAVRLNIAQVVVVGQGAKLIHMGASFEGSWDGESQYFEQISEAKAFLREMLTGNDIVLVKSSKSAQLRHLGDEIAREQA
jgi:UDP-N-acetylmuramoyl-tripeptide--D-alanyl-D-alanine ligase